MFITRLKYALNIRSMCLRIYPIIQYSYMIYSYHSYHYCNHSVSSLRRFEGIQLGVGAISHGEVTRTGVVKWWSDGRQWQGQLDPTGLMHWLFELT